MESTPFFAPPTFFFPSECAPFEAGQPWLRPLANQCRDLRARFAGRYQHQQCARRLKAAPEELRHGHFDLGGGETVAAVILLCETGFEAEIRERGGFFSAARLEVSLQLGAEGDPLALTGTLTAPESGEIWRLTDIDLSPGRLAGDLDPDAPETLHRCLREPESCLR